MMFAKGDDEEEKETEEGEDDEIGLDLDEVPEMYEETE